MAKADLGDVIRKLNKLGESIGVARNLRRTDGDDYNLLTAATLLVEYVRMDIEDAPHQVLRRYEVLNDAIAYLHLVTAQLEVDRRLANK